jgi:uncharacterized SAM-binding protein YcdF (DUF218 family)
MRNRRWFKVVAGLGLAIVLLGVAAWMFPRQVLTVDSGPVKADALVVLGGGSYERALRAAELFSEQAAPVIFISGVGDCDGNKKLLVQKGVPERAITLEDRSHTTLENAKFTVPLLRARGAERVIIVTTWYLSRRAVACFRHFAPDIEFYSRPSYFGYTGADWKYQGIKGYAHSEYAKLAGYLVRYGVSPF